MDFRLTRIYYKTTQKTRGLTFGGSTEINGLIIYFNDTSHLKFLNRIQVWIFGGYTKKDGEYLNDTFQFHLRDSRWEEVRTVGEQPARRTDHCMCLYGGELYVFGGFDGRNR